MEPTEKICQNCSYWNRNNLKMGDCLNDKFLYGDYRLYKNDGEKLDDCLVYWDYESYDAAFCTGENFGCIHFKKGA
jgi:hypothetical protein